MVRLVQRLGVHWLAWREVTFEEKHVPSGLPFIEAFLINYQLITTPRLANMWRGP